MEIINVITIENDVIQEVESFQVYNKDLSDEETNVAEELYIMSIKMATDYFIMKAKEYGYDADKDNLSLNELLEDGRYETEHLVYANVNLVWSQV